MNPLLNEIAQHLTGKTDLQSCSEQELEILAAKYPAFSTAHLLLAARSRQESHIQKANLFFPTGIWNNSLLESGMGEAVFTGSSIAVENPEITAEPVKAELETPFTKEELVEQTEEDRKTEVDITGALSGTTTSDSPVSETVAEVNAEVEVPFTEEELVDQTDDSDDESLDESPAEINIPFPKDLPTAADLKAAPAPSSELAGAPLAFEPYHTVDYFASQGIRFRDENKPKDRFSVQLKSFTEWLKAMKRLPESEIVAATTASEEKKVEQMAQVSISPREVVTETMAEVWEKQGNHAKAISVYEKLSLLDPGKSAYFAAKIEQLKNS